MAKKTCMFYGNCQMDALGNIFMDIQSEYNIIKIKQVHKLQKDDIIHMYELLPSIDILITQNISDNYKNNTKLSTKSILKQVSDRCKVIFLPNIYFDFYYPSETYLKTKNPKYYEHFNDANLIKILSSDAPLEYVLQLYRNVVDDILTYPKELLQNNAIKSLNELKKRESMLCDKYEKIIISDYIEKEYKDKLLFYTRNHPSEYILKHISDILAKKIGIDIKWIKHDPFYIKHLPLYASLTRIVNFDIKSYEPRFLDKIGLDAVVFIMREYYLNSY